MLTYQFDCLNHRGFRSCLVVSACASDRDAVSFAYSMLTKSCARVKVWRDDVMIHDGLPDARPN